ncbi:RteC domain-containing protein [Bacteroides fragilis]|nr:RteC domain-containing protein [Bacteroides fragilis]MCZ2537923.1 RteC domain-containing protein [Bacteroides fragilis]MCZ2635303.1 RteC domain-containing protein [Bacteroides fragilis]
MSRGKNALLLLVDEAIEVINTEIRILNMRIKYPIQFQNRKNSFPLSPLYLTDETNLVEIMEMVSGLFLSKRVVTHNGTESPLTEIGRAFEYLFNIKLGDVHKKHESVIKRKPSKLTEFLDTLRKAIIEESKKKGYL